MSFLFSVLKKYLFFSSFFLPFLLSFPPPSHSFSFLFHSLVPISDVTLSLKPSWSSQLKIGTLLLCSLGSLFIKLDCPWHLTVISCSCTCFVTPSDHLLCPSTNNVKGARNRSQSPLNLDHSIASESKHDHWFQLSLISIFPLKDYKALLKSESHPNPFPSTLPPPKLVMYIVCFKPKSQTRVRKQ